MPPIFKNWFFVRLVSLCLLGLWSSAPLLSQVAQKTKYPQWLEVDIGIIGVASKSILDKALNQAAKESLDGVLVKLDTPGGELQATRTMVKKILNSSVPVVVWVGPSGARATSAGAMIGLSANVLAMAEGTHIGASTPVQSNGADIGDSMKSKVMNDTVAFIESIAKQRGKDTEIAKSFVITALSLTSEQAKNQNICDLISNNKDDLLVRIHGKKWTPSNHVKGASKPAIDSAGATFIIYKQSFREKLLSLLSNPNLFYLLYLAGLMGLGYEISNPGMLFPGVFGAICLILAFIATSTLPVSFGAAALILAGIIMLFAEMFVPSFGALGIGGFIAFLLGSIFLVDPSGDQGLRVSLWTILPMAAVVAMASSFAGWLLLKTLSMKVSSGEHMLTGERGRVIRDFQKGAGSIKVAGEIWQARCIPKDGEPSSSASGPAKNQIVTVKRVEGMTAIVEMLDS